MGHDISGITRDGRRILGPHFSRFWWPHYEYLEASHHNEGISGDGEAEDVTPDQLRRALRRVIRDLQRKQDELDLTEERRPETGHTRDRDSWSVLWMHPAFCGDLALTSVQENADASDIGTWNQVEIRTLEELSEFLRDCIAEDVVQIRFW
jgi:hypothetical protein